MDSKVSNANCTSLDTKSTVDSEPGVDQRSTLNDFSGFGLFNQGCDSSPDRSKVKQDSAPKLTAQTLFAFGVSTKILAQNGQILGSKSKYIFSVVG